MVFLALFTPCFNILVSEDHFVIQSKPSHGLVFLVIIIVTLSLKKGLQDLGSVEGSSLTSAILSQESYSKTRTSHIATLWFFLKQLNLFFLDV